MADGYRKYAESIVLSILVVSLAVIFGTQFGPGSQGLNAEMLRGVPYIARVYGTTISEVDFQSAARLFSRRLDNNDRQLRQAIAQGLIERELLAHKAKSLGYRVTEDEINAEIRNAAIYVNIGVDTPPALSRRLANPLSARLLTNYSPAREGQTAPEGTPPFVYDDFVTYIGEQFGRTVAVYKSLMEHEMLAERMRILATSMVRASEDEVWRDYARQHDLVTLRYVKLAGDFYRNLVRTDDAAALTAWTAAHQSEIDHTFAERRESLKGLPLQVRARVLQLAYPAEADDAAKALVNRRAEALRARVAAGADFVRYVRLYSTDEATWKNGGEIGWASLESLQSVPEAVRTAMGGLQPGGAPVAVNTDAGAYVVQLLARRQGDVAEADAKADIARELFAADRAKALLDAAAAQARVLLAAPGATLDAVATQLSTAALEQFYRGPRPTAAETLAPGVTVDAIVRSETGAPEVQETSPFTRSGQIPGIPDGTAVAQAGFALTAAAPQHPEPITVGDDRFLIRLKDGGRTEPSREDFQRERAQLMESFVAGRRLEALQQFIHQLRAEAERSGQLRMGESSLIREEPAAAGPGAPAPAPAPGPASAN